MGRVTELARRGQDGGMSLDRALAPDPFDILPAKPSFTLESEDVADGQPMAKTFVARDLGGNNQSPQLRWSGFPADTRGFVVTCYDPDAPTMSGFWHWILVNLPPTVTELPRGYGSGENLAPGAFHVANDAGMKAYTGPFPPQGDRPHRYVFAVHAIDVEKLNVDDSVRAAVVGFNLTFHALARGVLRPTFQVS